MRALPVAVAPKQLAELASPIKPISADVVKDIAMDIGKELAAYIEVMYPEAVKASSSTFLLSVRNCVYNEIIEAIKLNDEGAIVKRLGQRKKFRRDWKAAYRKIRSAK